MTTVTSYVQPITQPLQDLHGSFTQLASQYRSINDQLRTHTSELLSGPTNFQGSAAQAFSSMVNYYLDASEKHMQTFDDVAGAVQTAHSDISYATDSAAGAGLNPTLTNHVLSRVTHDQIIQQGSAPVWTVVEELLGELHKAASDAGGIFSNLIHFHFSAAFDDLKSEFGDLKSAAGDLIGLAQNVGHVLGSWADTINSAVTKCLSFIGQAALKVGDFVLGISSMINDVKVLFDPHKSIWQKLEAVGDLALNVGMDVSMLFGVGEALKGGELLVKGGVMLADKFGKDEGEKLLEKEGEGLVDKEATNLTKDGLVDEPEPPTVPIPRIGQTDPINSSVISDLKGTSRGQEALDLQKKYNVGVEKGKPGGGTYYSSVENKMYIDPNKTVDRQGDAFVHEMTHAEYANTGKTVNVPSKMVNMSRDDYIKGMLHEEADGQVRAIEFAKQAGGKSAPPVYTNEYDKGYQQAVDALKAQNPAATPAELDQAGKKGAFQAVNDAFSQARPSTDPSITYPEKYGRAWDRIQAFYQQHGHV